MNADRWKVIKNLFQHAIKLPPEQWSAYLDTVCAGDQDLRHEVVSLLAEHVPYDKELRARLSGDEATLRVAPVQPSERPGEPAPATEEPNDAP